MKTFLVLLLMAGAALPQAKSSAAGKKPQSGEVIDFTPAKRAVSPGPFGFEAGMTKDQITSTLGARNIKRTNPALGIVSFSTAPAPHPDFNEYTLRFDDAGKLIQIIAFTAPISTNDSGEQLKDKFAEILKALHKKYGDALDVDRLNDGSIWNEENDWMMGLLKKDRKLESLWSSQETKLPNKLTGIMLEAEALNRSAGVITLTYEFDGFSQWADKQQNKRDSTF
jgi:hypothetical protein